jgi:hypothetical protein
VSLQVFRAASTANKQQQQQQQQQQITTITTIHRGEAGVPDPALMLADKVKIINQSQDSDSFWPSSSPLSSREVFLIRETADKGGNPGEHEEDREHRQRDREHGETERSEGLSGTGRVTSPIQTEDGRDSSTCYTEQYKGGALGGQQGIQGDTMGNTRA